MYENGIIGNKAIQDSLNLFASATAHRYPHRLPVIRRSVGDTSIPKFCQINHINNKQYSIIQIQWDIAVK